MPDPQLEPHRLVFIDVETTGLDPQRHEIWEMALVIDDISANGRIWPMDRSLFYPHAERLGVADPRALAIGRYYSRCPLNANLGWMGSRERYVGPGDRVASLVAPLLDGAFLVGCTVHFDAAFLDAFLRDHQRCPTWNYHLIDATTFAAGKLGLRPPWKSTTATDKLGLQRDESEAHTAMSDALMARRLYYATLGIDPDADPDES